MIIAGDLDSAELRINAWLAKDGPMLKILAESGKPHLDTAYRLFGEHISKEKDPERYKFAKSFYYQYLYTLPGKIPSDTGKLRLYTVEVQPEQLVKYTRALDKAHPAILADKKRAIADLHRTHKVCNVFGRYRDLSWGLFVWNAEVVAHVEQAALNFRVQTVIGTILNRAFVKLDKWFDEARANGLQGWPIIQCHDELVAYTPDKDEVPIIAKALKECIEMPVPEMDNLIIPAELKVGPVWGNCKEYKL